jgi:putative acetyltransferase
VKQAISSEIAEVRPDHQDAAALIAELDAHLGSRGYPKASQHGYSIEKLLREAVAFFVIRCDGLAAGCGGVEIGGREYAEIKRMYVRPAFRRQGLAKTMLEHLAQYARKRDAVVLRLETGIYETPAMTLYEAFGFRRRSAFGEYREDPFSVYYEIALS